MRDLFQEQLNELKRELTVMGASCEEIIALASQALTGWDEALAQKQFHTDGLNGTLALIDLCTDCFYLSNQIFIHIR